MQGQLRIPRATLVVVGLSLSGRTSLDAGSQSAFVNETIVITGASSGQKEVQGSP